jgi:Asp/Glu/hydantoin racemase
VIQEQQEVIAKQQEDIATMKKRLDALEQGKRDAVGIILATYSQVEALHTSVADLDKAVVKDHDPQAE